MFVLAACCLQWQSASAGHFKPVRRVLVLIDGNLATPAAAAADQEITAGLKKLPYAIERYSEYTESVLFSNGASHRKLREWYRDRKPHVIIAAGPSSTKFMVKSHEKLFGDTPIVLCASSVEQGGHPKLDSHFTGVWMTIDPTKTLEAALQLQPSTHHVVVVGGVSSYDKSVEVILREYLRSYESKLEFEYLTDLTMPALLERLRHLSDNTLVLYTSLPQDATGTGFVSASESLPMVVSVANAPVFRLADTLVGQGTVGGYVLSFAAQGRVAATMAMRVLQRERPQDIPIVTGADVYMFDWRALQRWRLRESALPPGSVVLYRQPAAWQSYRRYIIGAIFVVLVETLLVLGLLWQRARRRRVEAELVVTNDQLRLAMGSGKAVGWEWDVKTGRDFRFGDLKTMFGIPSDTYVGRVEDFYRSVHGEDLQQVSEAVADAKKHHKPYAAEFRVVWPDGTLRWVAASGKFYYSPNGEPDRMLGVAQDITERKRTDQALRESEERLRLAQEAVHVGMFEWDVQNNKNYQSPEMERIYGVSPGSFGGTYEAWIELVFPDDRERLERQVRHHLQEGGTVDSEFRIVRPSGETRWLFSRATLFCDSAGKPARMSGVSIDITERKRAEDALRESEVRERARLKELETLLDAAPISILIATDPQCKRITGNRAGSQLHHVPIGANFSRSASPVGSPPPFRIMRDGVEIPAEELPLQQAAATGIPVVGAFSTLVLEDGTERHMIGNAAPLFGEDGKPRGAVGAFVDITERKRAEDALRQSEERLRLAVQAGKMFVYEWDTTTDVLVRSAESAKILGIDEATHLTGQQILAKVHPDDRERLKSAVAELSPEKPHLEISYRMERPDGTEIWVEGNSRAHFDEQGRMLRIVGMVADITDRKRAEDALRESEERLHLAFQAGGMYAYEWDPLTDIGTRSAECIDILGKDEPLQITRRELSARVHPDDREQFAANPSQLTPEHPNSQTTYRVLRHDDSLIWLEKSARAFFDNQGRMLRMIGVVADITGRKHAEEALRESEERFRLVANTAPVMIWMSGADKLCTYFNTPWLAFTGRSIQAELGNGWAQGVHPEDFKTCLETYTKAFDRLEKFSMEYRLRRYDGEYRWVMDNGVPRFNQDGSFAGYIGSCVDVTDRKQAEDALRANEEKLRLLLDSNAEAIYGFDLEGRCTFCNPACLRALGYERADELLGKNMHQLIHHTRGDGTLFPQEECGILGALRTGEGVHVEDEVLWRANGTSFPVEYWSYPQRRGQEVVGGVVAFFDITERNAAEAALASVSRRLIEAQEKERTRIARELHDDIGQRLALLTIELDQLRQNSPDLRAEVRSRIGELHSQVSELATDIQFMSHDLHSSKLEYLGLTTAMKGFCKEFSEQQSVEVLFAHDDIPSTIPQEVSLCLFRVLQEALQNAVKHSGGRHFDVELRYASDKIHLTVRDSGSGFDVEQAMNTSGLGLVSMAERVKLVDGRLSIDSQPQRGTAICASVPLSKAARASA